MFQKQVIKTGNFTAFDVIIIWLQKNAGPVQDAYKDELGYPSTVSTIGMVAILKKKVCHTREKRVYIFVIHQLIRST